MAVNTTAFFGWEFGFGAIRAVFSEPLVVGKSEGLGRGVCSDVDLGLHLGAAEDDLVFGDRDLAARHEALARGFLEDTEDPLLRVKDSIASEEGSIDADEGGSTKAAFDDAILNREVFPLIGGIGRAEVVETGGAADIDGTFTSVFEVALFHGDIAGAAFELDGGAGGETKFTGKAAASNQRLVATDEIDPLPAPAGDGAFADGEFIKATALDGIMIAFGSDVADVEMIERDAFHGTRSLPAIIEVDAVCALAADFEMAEGETVASGELEGCTAAFEMRRLLRIEGLQS